MSKNMSENNCNNCDNYVQSHIGGLGNAFIHLCPKICSITTRTVSNPNNYVCIDYKRRGYEK